MQFTEEHCRSISVFVCIVLFPVLMLISCVPLATDFNKTGLNETQKGFAAMETTPDLHEIIELQHLNVHGVDREYFKKDKTAGYEINHLINFKHPNVSHPDNFDDIGV